jgi:DNA helicase-2/ATP-dependent DNA helicase PcrA
MRFKGEVRWSEPEEQALYREAKKCLNERYQHYSREVKRLRRSWMAADHLLADSIEQAGWNTPPDREPFFGRVDVSFDGATVESRYVGSSDIDVADTRIIDWRTPLAEVYYSAASMGYVSYPAPGGTVSIKLTLRRRFRNGAQIISTECERLSFYDDLQIDPERLFSDYLEEMLARYSDGMMRDIVRTIDEEQNEAIRTDKPCIVVVGRPGTGKTSVALHRIAYLNYKRQHESRGGRRTTHFAYISPTVRLCAYTSGVFRNIPDTSPEYWSADSLMDEIIKTHYSHFLSRRLPSIEDRLGYEERMLQEREQLSKAIHLFHTEEPQSALLNVFMEGTTNQIEDIIHQNKEIIEITEDFVKSLEKLIERLQEFLQKEQLNSQEREDVESLIRIVRECKDRIYPLMIFLDKAKTLPIELDEIKLSYRLISASAVSDLKKSLEKLAESLENQGRKYLSLRDVSSDMPNTNQIHDSVYWTQLRQILNSLEPLQLFRKAWRDSQVMSFVQRQLGTEALTYLQVLASRPADEIFYDEKPLLCLFMLSVFEIGRTLLGRYHAIAIDEVQNLPYSLLLCIRRMAPQGCDIILMADPDQRTSLLGSDTAQVARLFETTEYRLTRVYRSNPHILNAARALLNTQEPIVLVRREGLKPELYESPDENLAKLAKHLLDTKSYTNVAIITKCLEDAKALGQRVNLPVVSEDKAEILRGALIIPLSLCAGLEFDAVIVWNAADEQYAPDSEADKRKLYVASTRAMHQLIFHKYPKTPSKLVDALIGRQLVVPASL